MRLIEKSCFEIIPRRIELKTNSHKPKPTSPSPLPANKKETIKVYTKMLDKIKKC